MKMNLDAVFEDGFQQGQTLVNANFFEVSLWESAEEEYLNSHNSKTGDFS